MSQEADICEDAYERTFCAWMVTPKWIVPVRWWRRLQWQWWLRGLKAAVRDEVQ